MLKNKKQTKNSSLVHGTLYIVLYTLSLLLHTSCNKELTVSDFVEKISTEKDFYKKAESENYQIECEYIPGQLIAIQELQSQLKNGSLNKEIFEKELKKYDNALYFNLTIKSKNGDNIIKNAASQEEYTAMLSELTYNMERKIYLITDHRDTLPAINYNYSNTYGMSPDIKLVIAFPKNKELTTNDKKLELVYNDQLFGLNESLVFAYESEELNKKLPTIRFN